MVVVTGIAVVVVVQPVVLSVAVEVTWRKGDVVVDVEFALLFVTL